DAGCERKGRALAVPGRDTGLDGKPIHDRPELYAARDGRLASEISPSLERDAAAELRPSIDPVADLDADSGSRLLGELSPEGLRFPRHVEPPDAAWTGSGVGDGGHGPVLPPAPRHGQHVSSTAHVRERRRQLPIRRSPKTDPEPRRIAGGHAVTF